ncbi:MAG: 30S ribosomal protein S2 [Minisyncoccia bacterium]
MDENNKNDQKALIQDNEQTIQEMMKAGLHYGHKKTYNQPKADYFTIKSYEDLNVIDLKETIKALNKALDFLKEIVQKQGIILFVGTTASTKDLIQSLAQKFNYPYVNERWLGGTLTNFKTLTQRIKILKELEEKKATGGWEQYTKKEKMNFDKELMLLQKKFNGVRNLDKLPDAVFIVDTGINNIVVREARLLNIPIVGILDTDDDPTLVDYPIPANDSARSSIQYLLSKVELALEEGQKTANNLENSSKEGSQKEIN